LKDLLAQALGCDLRFPVILPAIRVCFLVTSDAERQSVREFMPQVWTSLERFNVVRL
jgi:hypothetical protein